MPRRYDQLAAADGSTDYSAAVPYEWKPLRAPLLQGVLLHVYVFITKTFFWCFFYGLFAEKSGIPQALQRTNVPELPIFQSPADTSYHEADAALCQRITGKKGVAIAAGKDRTAAFLECFSSTPRPESAPGPSVQEYHNAYKQGKTDPQAVIRFILNFLVKHNSPAEPSATAAEVAASGAAHAGSGGGGRYHLHWSFGALSRNAIQAAEASAARWRAGKPLSVLDGVPFAVKDHMPAVGFQGPAGTRFRKPTSEVDCPAVAALKAVGAIVVCATTMPELGMSPVGFNHTYGTPRNPWHLRHLCGGSSSGSAAVVAAGLVPFALASDAGGSVRIPAAHCGVVGLMPSVHRVPRQTAISISSCVVSGIIAGTAADCALAYAVIARGGGGGGGDGEAARPVSPMFGDLGPTATPLRLPRFAGGAGGTLAGVRLGMYRPWFDDCDEEVRAAAHAAVEGMQALGAEVVEVGIPDLHLCRVAHSATLGSDSLQDFKRRHSANLRRSLDMLGRDLQVVYASLGQITASDYITAARIRARMAAHMRAVFAVVDFIVTPTAPEVAPRLADAGPSFDLRLISSTMKFMQLGNILGLAAVSVPCGVDAAGLPIGLQVFGPAWHEASVLAVAQVLQAALPGVRDALPRRHVAVNPLEETASVADPDEA